MVVQDLEFAVRIDGEQTLHPRNAFITRQQVFRVVKACFLCFTIEKSVEHGHTLILVPVLPREIGTQP